MARPHENGGLWCNASRSENALDKENIELPAGSVEGDLIELSIRTLGLMKTPEEFNNLILKEEDKRIVRFKDIGFAEIDTENRKTFFVVTVFRW